MMVWLFYRCRVSEKTSLQDAYHYDSSQDTRSETPRHNKPNAYLSLLSRVTFVLDSEVLDRSELVLLLSEGVELEELEAVDDEQQVSARDFSSARFLRRAL